MALINIILSIYYVKIMYRKTCCLLWSNILQVWIHTGVHPSHAPSKIWTTDRLLLIRKLSFLYYHLHCRITKYQELIGGSSLSHSWHCPRPDVDLKLFVFKMCTPSNIKSCSHAYIENRWDLAESGMCTIKLKHLLASLCFLHLHISWLILD